MRKLLYIFLMFCLINCKNESPKNDFVLNGKVIGDVPEYIYLHYGNIKDSSIIVNDKFNFYGKVKEPTFAKLIVNPISTHDVSLYIEDTIMNIEIEIENRKLNNEMEVNFIKTKSFEGTKSVLLQSDFALFKQRNSSKKDWNIRLYKKLESIINKNPKHQYNAELLSEFIHDSILNRTQLKALYALIDSANTSRFSMSSIRKELYPKEALVIGNTIRDFNLPNQYTKQINTKFFRDSYLLIDFWASWCIPCRKQNVELKNIYREFKGNGFEVLGVSVDTDKEKWIEAINKDQINWENVLEIEGINGKVPADYNVSYLPFNVLIDRNGIIMGMDLKMNELEEVLKHKLKE